MTRPFPPQGKVLAGWEEMDHPEEPWQRCQGLGVRKTTVAAAAINSQYKVSLNT